MSAEQLPFDIAARYTGKDAVTFITSVGGEEITSERYPLGSGDRRRKVADLLDACLPDPEPVAHPQPLPDSSTSGSASSPSQVSGPSG